MPVSRWGERPTRTNALPPGATRALPSHGEPAMAPRSFHWVALVGCIQVQRGTRIGRDAADQADPFLVPATSARAEYRCCFFFGSQSGEIAPDGAIRDIRFICVIRVPPLNLYASMQALNSEFCILNSVIFAVPWYGAPSSPACRTVCACSPDRTGTCFTGPAG